MNNVVVGMIKTIPPRWEPERSMALLERLAAEIAGKGAQLIITPEGWYDGYAIKDKSKGGWDPERFRAVCDQPPDYPGLTRARQIAQDNAVHLVFGTSERRGENLYNSAYLIDPTSEILGRYDKLHVVVDDYTAGGALPVFPAEFGTVGMTICADRKRPEIIRAMAVKGALMICMPAWGMRGTPNDIWMRTKSVENAVWICFTHPEESLITDPDGEIAARLVADGNEYMIHTCDLDRAKKEDASRIQGRRVDVYGFAWETREE